MKRPALLLCLLCLLLSACAPAGEPPGDGVVPAMSEAPPAESAPPPPVRLKELNVEFAVEGRDPDTLRDLRRTLPDALTAALAAQNVTLEKVSVTFGPSGDTTAEAVLAGGVDLGFLSVSAALEDALPILALEEAAGPDAEATVLAGKRQPWTDALYAALADAGLRERLSLYTSAYAAGRYLPAEEDDLDDLTRLLDTGDTVLCRENARAGGKSLTLCAVGHKLPGGSWGTYSIEVMEGGTLLQVIGISEAAADGLKTCAEAPTAELSILAIDVNFDGEDDIRVCGAVTDSAVPYYFWLWDKASGSYVYRFTLDGVEVDPEEKTLAAVYQEGPGEYLRDTYEWQDGALALRSKAPSDGTTASP